MTELLSLAVFAILLSVVVILDNRDYLRKPHDD